jgi:hypothetical protein
LAIGEIAVALALGATPREHPEREARSQAGRVLDTRSNEYLDTRVRLGIRPWHWTTHVKGAIVTG